MHLYSNQQPLCCWYDTVELQENYPEAEIQLTNKKETYSASDKYKEESYSTSDKYKEETGCETSVVSLLLPLARKLYHIFIFLE